MAPMTAVRAAWQFLQWHAFWAGGWLRTRLGWSALAGAVALLTGTALASWSHQFRVQTRVLQAQIVDAERAAGVERAHRPDPAQRLRTFYAALPPAAEIPSTVERLLELAGAAHLTLHTGDYRAQMEDAGRYLSYRIALPVTGEARAVQSFLLAALHEQRTLALESVTFKRDHVEAREIEAHIQFALITDMPIAGEPAPLAVARAGAQ